MGCSWGSTHARDEEHDDDDDKFRIVKPYDYVGKAAGITIKSIGARMLRDLEVLQADVPLFALFRIHVVVAFHHLVVEKDNATASVHLNMLPLLLTEFFAKHGGAYDVVRENAFRWTQSDSFAHLDVRIGPAEGGEKPPPTYDESTALL